MCILRPIVGKCVKTIAVCGFEFVCSVKTHHDRQPVKCKEKGRERERERGRGRGRMSGKGWDNSEG